ncbi:MAG: translation initiation factor IF-1A [Euryarchaeota archaeon]|jgi:translation initiation factor 1A|nr:translation initiation factor IF-1A [Euryarchaeota archaeon]HIK01385.1 translation initiation factor IF-1A [Candidatus Undinarchaeales archaeon ERR594346 U_76725]|tara:strand:+ start:5099 stop:5584 length:486 start_codon:yes stop_codon:yes gene_type:complete
MSYHKKKKKHGSFDPNAPVRVRMPRTDKREVLGIIIEHYGTKLLVECMDGYTRLCRVPGKIRYKLRVKPGDVILVQKWPIQENEKGDYLYKYRPNQINILRRKGLLTTESEEKEKSESSTPTSEAPEKETETSSEDALKEEESSSEKSEKSETDEGNSADA